MPEPVVSLTRRVRVAAGVFAPGQLGELTRQVPFEMVDAVLTATGRVQQRVRLLPSRVVVYLLLARVVVYLLLAGCLFGEMGYGQVWHRLVAGLDGLRLSEPTAAALSQARRRVGPAPLRALFELVAGPAACAAGPVRWRGLLVCAIDGAVMTVADSAANLTRYVKQRGGPTGGSSYPMLRLVAVVACGTRSIIDAAFGATSRGETTYAAGLVSGLRPGMILLADRNFAAGRLVAAVAAAGAQMLVRAKTGVGGPKLPVLHRYRDGSYRSLFAGVAVRVVDAQITLTTTAGRSTGRYRLITTLLDAGRYPAAGLVELYHQRWEIETAYREVKSGMLDGRVLRARTPDGVEQEVYALLVTYQALRTAISDAANASPGLDPDRASFSIALHAARDQLVRAAGILAGPTIDLAGAIGRLVTAHPLPARRLRVNARTVKRAISKYNARGPNIDRASYPATMTVTILASTT